MESIRKEMQKQQCPKCKTIRKFTEFGIKRLDIPYKTCIICRENSRQYQSNRNEKLRNEVENSVIIYLIRPKHCEMIKVGFWSGPIDKLKVRYRTTYGEFEAYTWQCDSINDELLLHAQMKQWSYMLELYHLKYFDEIVKNIRGKFYNEKVIYSVKKKKLGRIEIFVKRHVVLCKLKAILECGFEIGDRFERNFLHMRVSLVGEIEMELRDAFALCQERSEDFTLRSMVALINSMLHVFRMGKLKKDIRKRTQRYDGKFIDITPYKIVPRD
jgi:hypothetical protein